MLRFLLRRLLFGVLVVWLVATTVFFLAFAAPQDPAVKMAGKQATPEVIELVRQRLQLDDPILVQYGRFLTDMVQGDLGFSFFHDLPVSAMILDRLPVTASLVAGAAVLWLVFGIAIGVLSATRPRSLLDRAVTGFVLTGISMPTFLVALVLIYLLFFRLHEAGLGWFAAPNAEYIRVEQDPLGWAHQFILPWVALAFVQCATYTRLTRGSMLDVLGEDYIRTARAKGLTERRVTYRHGLRAALTPVLTQFGIDVGTMLAGVIVTESVFGLQGIGQLALFAFQNGDLPLIVGIVIFASFFIVIANLVVDLLYSVLDPRVRLS